MVGLALGAALVACGTGTDEPEAVDVGSQAPSDAASTPAASSEPASTLPDCAAVWQEGSTLPVSYRGCSQDGVDVKADKRDCSFGRPLVIFDDGFYALAGARVNVTQGPVADDPDYRSALASCTA